jgi:O-antigen/teichoic acid export membrane protein
LTSDPETVLELATTRFGAQRLFRDAGSMASSSMASAVLGMVFWTIAAKLYPPEQLGVMAAVLSVITSVSTVVAASTGDTYTVLLPAAGPARASVYRRGQRLWICLAIVGGVGGALTATLSLSQVYGSFVVAAVVAFGVAAWSGFLLQNSTLTALGRARWLPAIYIVTSVGKILLLPLLAITLAKNSVELAFIIPAAVVVLALRPAIARAIRTGKDLPKTATVPEDQALHEFNKLALQMAAFAVLNSGVTMLTPFLVTKFAGPADGALFALCLTIVQTLDFVAAAMAVSLVVHASSAPEHGGRMARSILVRTFLLVAAGAVVLTAVVPIGLPLINAQYGEMGPLGVMAVLCLGSIVRVAYMVWAALQRSRRKMRGPLALNFVGAVLLLALIPTLAGTHGAFGGAIAVAIPQIIMAVGAVTHLFTSRAMRKRWPEARK